MPIQLPPNFSPYEHLQDTCKRAYNRLILEHFNDVEEDADVSVPRASLKVACTHLENDSLVATVLRMLVFEMTLRGSSSLQPGIYGIPIQEFEASTKYLPQIKLFFLEDFQDVAAGFQPVQGEITFRVSGAAGGNLTMAEVQTFATRVKQAFATPPFVWKKGWDKFTYLDREEGIDLRILAFNETEAKRVIEAVLDIRNVTPNYINFKSHIDDNPSARYPINPGTQVILGQSRKKFRRRPRADVRFRYATLNIQGLPNPLTLVDLSGTRANPIVD